MSDQNFGRARGRPAGGKNASVRASGKPRIPVAFEGIQVNYCKNIDCKNFGVPAQISHSKRDPHYTMTGDVKLSAPSPDQKPRTNTERSIKCKACGSFNPIKNNRSIVETQRILDWHPDNFSCPTEDCINHHLPIEENPKLYQKWGTTQTGNQRWKCKVCKKSFVVQRNETDPSRGRQHSRYVSSIKTLLNDTPLNRILEIQEINPAVLYHNIDRAYEA